MFKNLFNLLYKRNAKVSLTRENKITIAETNTNNFFEETFDRDAVRDDERDPRRIIHNNALRILEIMRDENLPNEEFEEYYNEILNIGDRAYAGHPLYRNLTKHPHPDNTIAGIIGRFFAHYEPEERIYSEFDTLAIEEVGTNQDLEDVIDGSVVETEEDNNFPEIVDGISVGIPIPENNNTAYVMANAVRVFENNNVVVQGFLAPIGNNQMEVAQHFIAYE